MQQYTLAQSIKALEKLFENNIDSEQKIKALKWEDLKQFNPVEKSFIMDLKEAIAEKNVIGFLAGKNNKGGEK